MLIKRPYLFSRAIQYAEFLQTVNFRWNETTKKLYLVQDKSQLLASKLACKLHTLASVTIILQIVHHFTVKDKKSDKHKISMEDYMKIVNGAVLIVALNAHVRGCQKHAHNLVKYVNGILEVQRKYFEENIERSDRLIYALAILFVNLAGVTVFTFPIGAVYLLHWTNPCKPSLAGYWLLKECRYDGHTKIPESSHFLIHILNGLIKAGVFLFNHWAWAVGFSGAIVVVIGMQILCILSLRECLENCIIKKVSICKAGPIYRNVQYLSALGNMIGECGFMDIIITVPIIVQAFCLTILIRMPWTSGRIIEMGMFAMLYTDATLAMAVCLTGMMNLYIQSKTVLTMLKDQFVIMRYGRLERKWLEKFMKSCKIVKVAFGNNNFVEEETLLNCISFSSSLTLQMLLLGM